MGANVICVIDGAAGSCGKAKVIGELVTNESINVLAAVTNCMPNAGHTYVSESGEKYIFRNIPVSIVNPNVELFIGPGSVIEMETFIKEYDKMEHLLGNRKIYVHERIPLITEEHREREREKIKSGSTRKGCGAALQDKILRDPDLEYFKGYKNAVVLDTYDWVYKLHEYVGCKDGYVLLEGAQGCDLSLNFSPEHPFVTSRNVSSSQLLSDSGLAPSDCFGTVMVIRPFPIRINNITDTGEYIYTGGYGEADPLTWSQINLAAKLGVYPTIHDSELFDFKLNDQLKRDLLRESSANSLLQIFGPNYKKIELDDINCVQAMEMERLIYKELGIKEYVSDIVDLSDSVSPYIRDLSETTTVTNKERRIFDLDIKRLKYNIMLNKPYALYLNFFQHLDLDAEHKICDFEAYQYSKYVREYLNYIEYSTNVPISMLGTGMKNNERIKIRELVNRCA